MHKRSQTTFWAGRGGAGRGGAGSEDLMNTMVLACFVNILSYLSSFLQGKRHFSEEIKLP